MVCNSVRDRCVVPVRCNSSSPVPIPAPAPKAVGRIPMAWSCGCLIDALKRYPDSLIGRERGEPFIELEHERLTTGVICIIVILKCEPNLRLHLLFRTTLKLS